VRNKTLSEATNELTSRHLGVDAKTVASGKKLNTVIDQNPKPGSDVKRNSKVTITVSGGAGEGLVPDVAGKTIEEATKTLTKHFEVKVDPAQPSTAIDPDHVVSTNPPIGTPQKFGTTIHLIPSSGISVPPVVGLPQQDAFNLLSAAGFNVRTLQEQSDSQQSGNVTRTSPPVGTNGLKGGTPIDMYVSTGAALVDVPSVEGRSVDDATKTLKDKGFESTVILEPTTLKGNDGKVLSQNPGPNEQARPGSTIVLNVGQYTPPSTTPNPTRTTTTTTTGP
jgi:serine/threonine-protein kinase